jgi:anti-sigma regulatory factor (Ser/Thr protein kinase)
MTESTDIPDELNGGSPIVQICNYHQGRKDNYAADREAAWLRDELCPCSYVLLSPWRKVFPGQEAELRQLRRWIAGLLPEAPARDDVVMVAVELANAIRHTASGRNGFFAVEITQHAQPTTVRIAVTDDGAPTGPQILSDSDPLSEHGRGLQVVRGLASRTGACGDQRGRLVWADVPWTGDSPAEPLCLTGHEAAIRGGQAVLDAEHAGTVTWFGRATLQWWALTGQRGTRRLITAPSAHELARKLRSSQASARARRGSVICGLG